METFATFLADHQSGVVDVSGIHVDMSANHALLGREEIQLLKFFLRLKKPKKVLEIGVAEGGGTMHILDELPPDSVLYSVDCAMQRRNARNEMVPIGHYAADYYDEKRHARWVRFFGYDVSECIEEIGEGIDCVILDTSHSLPGEVLSYLSVLPFCDDKCLLMLDDISLHSRNAFYRKLIDIHTYCNHILFSSILSQHKFTYDYMLPNFACIVIDKKICMQNITFVLNCLFIPWEYIPNKIILMRTYTILKKYYQKNIANVYKSACVVQHRVFFSRHKLLTDGDADNKNALSDLVGKAVYYFGIGAAYEQYKHLFSEVRPQAALVSMVPASGLPDTIDGIPVRFVDDVLAGNNAVLPVILFARQEHAKAMTDFLEENYPAWAGKNILVCLLDREWANDPSA